VTTLVAIVPSIGALFLFWVALRAILQADRRERRAQARIEAAEDRAAAEAAAGAATEATAGAAEAPGAGAAEARGAGAGERRAEVAAPEPGSGDPAAAGQHGAV
jgi:hypothetical protein